MRKDASRVKQQYFRSTDSQLSTTAATIVDYVAEVKKPDGERLPGFHEAQLESLRHRLFSPAPMYPALEIARMTGALEADVAELGANDPFLKMILNGRSPHEVATGLVNGTKLADPALRKKLVEGGEAAVAASDDPMIVLFRKLDPMRREMIKWEEDNVQSVEQEAGEKLGKARFAAYGKTTYPDATFTLRLSYGQVKGYPMNGTEAPYKTTFYGLYDRANSFDFDGPFYLPSRYKEDRDEAGLGDAARFRDDQRHYRRQFGLAGDQSQRGNRRSDLRWQYRVAGGRLRVRRDVQSRGGGTYGGHDGSTAEAVWHPAGVEGNAGRLVVVMTQKQQAVMVD